jgi:hypothetical protein
MSAIAMMLLPLFLQIFGPVIVQTLKNSLGHVVGKLPPPVTAILAGAVGEAINQAQAPLSGAALPPGASGFITILLATVMEELRKAPPPAVVPPPAPTPTTRLEAVAVAVAKMYPFGGPQAITDIKNTLGADVPPIVVTESEAQIALAAALKAQR